nr:immune inhibitor A domain-containing protein [Streptomyces scabiei]
MTCARAYKKLSYPLDAYAGKKIELRFRYQTDDHVPQKGVSTFNVPR